MFSLFSNRRKKEEKRGEEEKPGRAFKRLMLGEYFGLQDKQAPKEAHQRAMQRKTNEIKRLQLKPAHLRYIRKTRIEKGEEHTYVAGAHVAFQKEEYNERWHMVHVTEVSFLVRAEEFDTFQTLCGVRFEDFRDLTDFEYKGKERRKKPREMPTL